MTYEDPSVSPFWGCQDPWQEWAEFIDFVFDKVEEDKEVIEFDEEQQMVFDSYVVRLLEEQERILFSQKEKAVPFLEEQQMIFEEQQHLRQQKEKEYYERN